MSMAPNISTLEWTTYAIKTALMDRFAFCVLFSWILDETTGVRHGRNCEDDTKREPPARHLGISKKCLGKRSSIKKLGRHSEVRMYNSRDDHIRIGCPGVLPLAPPHFVPAASTITAPMSDKWWTSILLAYQWLTGCQVMKRNSGVVLPNATLPNGAIVLALKTIYARDAMKMLKAVGYKSPVLKIALALFQNEVVQSITNCARPWTHCPCIR